MYNIYYNLADRFDIRLLSSSHLNEAPSSVVHAPFLVEHRFGKEANFAACYEALSGIGGSGDLSGVAVGFSAPTRTICISPIASTTIGRTLSSTNRPSRCHSI